MLITFKQFEKVYMGKLVRDGQCVALFRQYAVDCGGIPHTGSVEGAINLWTSWPANPLMQKYFLRVEDKEDLIQGDAVIFAATRTNKYGHVALLDEVHTDGMSVIEQDGIKLDGVKPAFWTFTRFVGALRLIPQGI